MVMAQAWVKNVYEPRLEMVGAPIMVTSTSEGTATFVPSRLFACRTAETTPDFVILRAALTAAVTCRPAATVVKEIWIPPRWVAAEVTEHPE